MGLLGDGIIGLIQTALFIYDVVTYPLYTAIQQPWKKTRSFDNVRSTVLNKTDKKITIEPVVKTNTLLTEFVEAKIDTMAKCFQFGLKKYSHNRCLGTRALLDEEDETQPNGKIFKKMKMGILSLTKAHPVKTKNQYHVRGDHV